jgi:hypothetical protein
MMHCCVLYVDRYSPVVDSVLPVVKLFNWVSSTALRTVEIYDFGGKIKHTMIVLVVTDCCIC